jgi:hypothetical protein
MFNELLELVLDCEPTITNIATAQIFEVTRDKHNVNNESFMKIKWSKTAVTLVIADLQD